MSVWGTLNGADLAGRWVDQEVELQSSSDRNNTPEFDFDWAPNSFGIFTLETCNIQRGFEGLIHGD